MALGPVRLATLSASTTAVDDQGRFSSIVLRYLNNAFQQITTILNQIVVLPEIQQALLDAQAATAAAQAAADAANAAASDAQDMSTAQARESAIQSSYITPDSVLTASTTLISVAAHVRHYGDGTTANVSAGTVPVTGGTAPYDNYVSYVQPSRAGGAVTYVASTTNPAQTGDTHVVGAVTVPATGTATGGKGPTKPGYVEP